MTPGDLAFFELAGLDLTARQVSCAGELDRLLAEVDAPFVDPDCATATVNEAGHLSLELEHRLVPEVQG